MSQVFIGVGSNIRPDENVRRAVRLLANGMRVIAISNVYETAAEGRPEQSSYYNCVVQAETEAPPAELKSKLRGIEDRLGRVRNDDKYAPRTMDLDLLIYDELVVTSAEMTLPAPEIARRPYLAVALRELAAELTLPGSAMTMTRLAEGASREDLHPLKDYTIALRREIAHGQQRRQNRRPGATALS